MKTARGGAAIFLLAILVVAPPAAAAPPAGTPGSTTPGGPTRPPQRRPAPPPTSLWYRVQLSGRDEVAIHEIDNGGGTREGTTAEQWQAKSNVAFILGREPALVGPRGERPSRRDSFVFDVNLGGELTGYTSLFVQTYRGELGLGCPPHRAGTRLTDRGLIGGHLAGSLTGSSGTIAPLRFVNGAKPAEGTVTRSPWNCPELPPDDPGYESQGNLGPPLEPCVYAKPGDVTVAGRVRFGSTFTVVVDCTVDFDTGTAGTPGSHIENRRFHYAMTFKPCPSRGWSVRRC